MPLVDVVIVNFNAGPYLRQVVDSLQTQTFRDFNVIIIDNGSTDDSLDGLPEGEIDVRVVRTGCNLGFAAGNNLALDQYVTAEWIALLNPDAFPRADWLERLLDAVAMHPDFSFFGCKMVDARDPGILDGVGDVYHISGLHWRKAHGCRDSEIYGRAEEIFAPCAAAAMYKAKDLRAIGGFDEDYFCYSEDVDLAFRLRLMGNRCLYVPNSIVAHVGSGITGVHSDFSLYHGHRNLVWTFIKNVPAPLFWIYLPYHLLLNLLTIIIFSLRGRSALLLRAKRDALVKIPYFWRKRRAVQALRRISPSRVRAVMQGGLPRRHCA